MRISDWSSDVCSSDLLARVLQALLLTCERSFSLVNLALLVSQFLCLRTLFDLGGDARPAAVMDARARRFQRLLEIGDRGFLAATGILELRSEEHTSELQSLMRLSYAVFCLKKKHNIKESWTSK